ncbi:MAG: transglycosylase SLT domain-containing protein [Bacteroidota bacterium]
MNSVSGRIGKTLFIISFICSFVSAQKIANDKYDEHFQKYSKRYFGPAFDWKIFKAQGYAESNLDPEAKSWVGAKGLMQLMPATYADIQLRNPELGEIADPRWNIAAGIYYNRQLWKRWEEKERHEERMHFVFASYNAGLQTIKRAQQIAAQESLDVHSWLSIETIAPNVPRWRHEETVGYVRKIDKNHEILRTVRQKKR